MGSRVFLSGNARLEKTEVFEGDFRIPEVAGHLTSKIPYGFISSSRSDDLSERDGFFSMRWNLHYVESHRR